MGDHSESFTVCENFRFPGLGHPLRGQLLCLVAQLFSFSSS